MVRSISGPHSSAVAYSAGVSSAPVALVLLHGRGGSATDILSLTQIISGNYFAVAPEAVGRVWYPERFLLPQTQNEPFLSSALQVVESVVDTLVERGYQHNQIMLAGFSQGACLAAEYVKRHPAGYAGLVIMSGGLIGDDAEVESVVSGALPDLPVYVGCDAEDGHIPLSRVKATAQYFGDLGANVSLEIFNDFGHRIHPTAISFIEELLLQKS